jgi:hypothetical protein
MDIDDLDIHLSERNVGLAPAVNWFFKKYADAPYVVKVDNDTVLPDNWLADLMEVMEATDVGNLGAVSGTCLRPYGPTFKDWVKSMPTRPFRQERLYFHDYVLGTGVLINMEMIRRRGLLFEHFPRSPESGPDDPCLISGWTAYTREAALEGWRFAFYSKVHVNLLNLKAEHVLSGDYPEYDAEVQKGRDQGNAWWVSVGGMPGVQKYVREHGGLESLPGYKPERLKDPALTWSVSDRSGREYWVERIKQYGPTMSGIFLSERIARIDEFTERHLEIVKRYATGKDLLDMACGWGRLSLPLSRIARTYVGVDFVPALIEKARESIALDFRIAEATVLPFADQSFDVVVAVACMSSFATNLEKILAEVKRVLRPDGVALFLEEDYARIDWKMRNV